jgi:hypothetical protein
MEQVITMMMAVAEAGGLGPCKEIFPTPPLYKITEIFIFLK